MSAALDFCLDCVQTFAAACLGGVLIVCLVSVASLLMAALFPRRPARPGTRQWWESR